MDFTKIKNLREEHHLTQNQLAEKLGVSDKSVRNWERGESEPKSYLAEIATVFFSANMDALHAYFSDEADNGSGNVPIDVADVWDCTEEERMLTHALESGTIQPVYAAPLRSLLDPEKKDAAGTALCSFLGVLRHSPSLGDDFLLGEMASMMQRATNFDFGAEAEMLIHDLITRLLHLGVNRNLSEDNRQKISEVIGALQDARFSNIETERVNALRHCFFHLYDCFGDLKGQPGYYEALSDIAIPLGGIAYSAKDRRHLFYSLFQTATALSASSLKGGG